MSDLIVYLNIYLQVEPLRSMNGGLEDLNEALREDSQTATAQNCIVSKGHSETTY